LILKAILRNLQRYTRRSEQFKKCDDGARLGMVGQ
jgi:hypothetical protein